MGVTIEKGAAYFKYGSDVVVPGWFVRWTDPKTGLERGQWFATKKEADWFYKWKERDSDRSGYGTT